VKNNNDDGGLRMTGEYHMPYNQLLTALFYGCTNGDMSANTNVMMCTAAIATATSPHLTNYTTNNDDDDQQ
jgi:hypothetical protein